MASPIRKYMMRWIYISPHLDDAIYSAGGLIYEQIQSGFPVEIWTVMARIPEHDILSSFAKDIHREWGTSSTEETIKLRRAENEKAAAIVGAKNHYLDFVDSLYRIGHKRKARYLNSFSPIHEEEDHLPERIAEELSKLLEPGDHVVCPLALGGHVDHVIVRQAVEKSVISPLFVADVPYIMGASRSLWRETLMMKKEIHAISEEGLLAWIKGIGSYESQIKVEFDSIERMKRQITAYWKKYKGIRLWRKR